MTTEELRSLHTCIPEADILEMAALIEPESERLVQFVQDNAGFLSDPYIIQFVSQAIAKIALTAVEYQKRKDDTTP